MKSNLILPKMRPPHPNLALYGMLMEQVKWRTEVVRKTIQLVQRSEHYLPNLAAAELCLLQLRMICELIALGCIAIHTDVPQTRKLQGMWNADAIMKEFSRLKPNYFPVAAAGEPTGPGTHKLEKSSEVGMTPKEFLERYNFFGSQLHAGKFKSLKDPNKKQYHFETLLNFLDKLRKLLSVHIYSLDGEDRIIRIVMNDSRAGGRVGWNELLKV